MNTDIPASMPANIRAKLPMMSPSQREAAIDYFRRNDKEELRASAPKPIPEPIQARRAEIVPEPQTSKPPAPPELLDRNTGPQSRTQSRTQTQPQSYVDSLYTKAFQPSQSQALTQSPVESIIDSILEEEGGYQEHKEDRGNKYKGEVLGTKYGITPQALASFRGTDVTKEDIKNLTQDEAKVIYKEQYVTPLMSKLELTENNPVLPQLVDIHVNSGEKNTIKLLQKVIGATADGIPGPETRKKIERFITSQGADELNKRLAYQRMMYYAEIVSKNPKQSKFLKGWLGRAARFS